MFLEYLRENLILSILFFISLVSLIYIRINKVKSSKKLLSATVLSPVIGTRYTFIYKYSIFKKAYYDLEVKESDPKTYLFTENLFYDNSKDIIINTFSNNINVRTVNLHKIKHVIETKL